MVNILGERNGPSAYPAFDGTWEEFARQHTLPEISGYAATEIFVHIYGKMETKPERKMGHITVLADDQTSALSTAKEVRNLIEI